jgi:hypothetical protein
MMRCSWLGLVYVAMFVLVCAIMPGVGGAVYPPEVDKGVSLMHQLSTQGSLPYRIPVGGSPPHTPSSSSYVPSPALERPGHPIYICYIPNKGTAPARGGLRSRHAPTLHSSRGRGTAACWSPCRCRGVCVANPPTRRIYTASCVLQVTCGGPRPELHNMCLCCRLIIGAGVRRHFVGWGHVLGDGRGLHQPREL